MEGRIMRRASLLLVLIIGFAGLAPAQVIEDLFLESVASGDPRPTSVVLWTRVTPPAGGASPETAFLEVATDADFTDVVVTRNIEIDWQYDGVVKVLVDGLTPYTTYYYRFSVFASVSPVGRTKTAPTPDMDVPVKYAVVYCQDYIGRYYNTYLKLLRDYAAEDIDFVVHLGDYIYETTGDPAFQDPTSERRVVFSDLEGAIPLGSPPDLFFAAASLSNYRDIYRTYRSDPVLQQAHERWPFIVTWDDHEYSNDAWAATATYFNGRIDEYDSDRKRSAEQAFFEWVPSEVGIGDDGLLDINASNLYPNTMIYRDYLFGSNLHLVMTDGRTERPDHLVAEDAFPGAIAVDQEGLIDLLGDLAFEQVRGSFDPYVNMDILGAFLPIFKQTATLITAGAYQLQNPYLDLSSAVKVAEAALAGNQSTTILNLLFAEFGLSPPFTPEVLATLPRGVSYAFIGKQAFYSSAGSRTQVLHDTFNLYAAHLFLTQGPAVQDVYGGLQTAWMQGTLLASPATWKVLAQSVMMTPLVVDFTNPLIASQLPPVFPDELRTRFGVIAEDFNGFPQKRLEILGLLGVVPNAVVISGDIHSTFVTDHTNGVYEFTGPGISSATIGEEVARRIASDPILGQIPGLDQLAQALGLLLQVSSFDDELVSPSDIVYTNTGAHGFMIMDVMADSLRAVMYEIPEDATHTSYYDDPAALDALFTMMPFTVQDGQLIPGM
jgi:alkaline phosphatase D